MKLTKRFLSLLLAVVMVLSMIPAVYAADEAEAPAPTRGAALGASKTYEYDHEIVVDDQADLIAAMKNNDGANAPELAEKKVLVRMSQDIEITTSTTGTRLWSGYYADNGAKQRAAYVILDLGGHTLSSTLNFGRFFGIYGGGTLIITNGTIKANGGYKYSGGIIFCQGVCTGVLDGVDLQVSNATADHSEVNGGVFVATSNGSSLSVYNSTITYEGVGSKSGGLIAVSGGKNSAVTLENSVFVGGEASNVGGQIYVEGGLNAKNCSFEGSKGTSGAVIYKASTTNAYIEDCDFKNTEATDGGVLYHTSGYIYFDNCTFKNCSATEDGGVYYQKSYRIYTDNCTFEDCSAGLNGGVIWSQTTYLSPLDNSTFKNCTAGENGGVAYSTRGATDISGCTFISCSAKNGGVVYTEKETTEIKESTFTDCSATENGGVICAKVAETDAAAATIKLTDCQIEGANAGGNGGAIYGYYKSGTSLTLTVTDCYIEGRAAGIGGAIYTNYVKNTIKNSEIRGVAETGVGGAIRHQSLALSIADSTVYGETLKNSGGAIYFSSSNASTFTNSNISGKAASSAGALIRYGSATLTITGCDMTGQAEKTGGVMLIYSSGTTVINEGTVIHDGIAKTGGGNISATSYEGKYPTIVMNDGIIRDGATDEGGGNVNLMYGRFIMNGGEILGGTTETTGAEGVRCFSSGFADKITTTDENGESVETTLYDMFYLFGGTVEHISGGAKRIVAINGRLGTNVDPVSGHSTKVKNADGYYTYTHSNTDGTENDTPATCTTEGKIVVVCDGCTYTHNNSTVYGGNYEYVAPVTAHTAGEAVIENEVASTCTAEGSYDSVTYCTICNAEVSRETITVAAVAHTVQTVTGKAATCTEDGLTDGEKCSVCGTVTKAQDKIPALGHSYKETVTAPGCETNGYTTYTCENCDHSYTGNETEATGHAWDEGVIDPKPTCNDAGVKTYTCATCGETKTEAVDATGHTEVTDAAVAPTCTTTGLTEGKHCSVCGTVTAAQEEVPALGHTEVTDAAVAPTCTETGLTEGKHCSVCGTVTVAQQEVPALGHSYTGVKTEATFENDAFTTYTCSVCGDSYTETEEGTKLTAVATADGVPFKTLQEALTAGGTVVLLQDVADSDTLEVKNTVVLDLNGKTVSMNDASGKAAQLIKNSGNLTIMDSVGNGKLTFHSTTPSESNSYSTSTIINVGALKILSGTIENTTTSGPSYAIDNAWYTTDVSLSVEGGTVTAQKVAIRQVPFSTTAKNTITISGGELSGYAGLQIHNYQKTACLSDVTITGGTFTGSYAFYTSYSYNNTATGTNIAIDGGEFNGYVYLYNGKAGSSEYPMTVSVTGGTFNSGYYAYCNDSTGAMVAIPSVTGGTHIYDVTDYCVEGYGMHDNGDGTYGIHEHVYVGVKTEATFENDAFTTYTCGTCGDSYTVTEEGTQLRVPTADVGKLEALTLKAGEYGIYTGSLAESTEDLPLEVVVKLAATETEAGSMADWLVDFNLTFTGMANGSITADNCYLAGNYGTFGWIAIPTDGMVLEDGVTYPVVAVAGIHLNYNDIVTSVKEFIAAIHIDQAILDANPDLEVKLELVMTDPEDADNKIQVGQDMIYSAEDLKNEEAPLPEALVTPMDKITLEEDEYRVWNGMVREPGITEDKALVSGEGKLPLEVVVNFQAQDTLEECLAGGYSKWLVDFNITVEGLANGSFVADNCYLAGNYGSYGWIKIPLDGQTIREGVAYPVVALYDPTLNYKDICKSVKDFTAAIHIDQAILDANPNLTVKLELVMTNPNTSDTLQIGEDLIYGFEALKNGTVAMNKETGAVYTTVQAAIDEAEAGQTVVLLANCEEEELMVKGGVTLDLNGYTLTASDVVASFASSHIIDSTDGKGLLVIERDGIAIHNGNANLPVWMDNDGGYRFVKVELRQNAKLDENGNGYFRFYIVGNDAKCALQQALADGGADNGVSVRVTLEWKDLNGNGAGKTFIYKEEQLIKYAANWTGNEFRLTVTGMEKVSELSLTAALVSEANASTEVTISGKTKSITK